MTTQVQELQTKEQPRLTPVENPESIKIKLAYWFIEWKMGKTITPLKVVYARFPEGFGLAKELMELEDKFTIPERLQHLIRVYTATLNGCAFCINIGKAMAQNDDVKEDVFEDLMQFEDSSVYSSAEKAALRYVDEATRNKHVSDSTFEQLKKHFNDRDIVQITLINAIENFYNVTNAPLNIGSDELCKLMNK